MLYASCVLCPPCAPHAPRGTPQVLDILQKLFYRSNPAREAFVELCDDNYVQKMTFDSYLYKVCAARGVRGGQPRLRTRPGQRTHGCKPRASPSCPALRPYTRVCTRTHAHAHATPPCPRKGRGDASARKPRASRPLLRAPMQTVVPGNPVDDLKLLVRTVGSLVRANALRTAKVPVFESKQPVSV